jgi:hypothetical protein
MSLIIKSFITICLALSIKIGHAQSWLLASNANNGAQIYINANPVYLPHTIMLWVRTTGETVTNTENSDQPVNPNSNTMCLVEFDCMNLQYKVHSIFYLDSNGKVTDHLDLNANQTPWIAVIQDSAYEKVLKKVCEDFN